MNTVEIVGYKRANLGKTESKRLRAEGMVPGVIYGGDEQIPFYAPMILFRDIVYTGEAHFVNLNIEGKIVRAILQDIQFHPVSEFIMHVDFLQLFDDKAIKMEIPIKPVGNPPGIKAGGKLVTKLRTLTLKGLPNDMPDFVEVNVSKLGLGKSIKVGEVTAGNYEIMNSPLVTIMSIDIPRALRGKTTEESDDEEGGSEE